MVKRSIIPLAALSIALLALGGAQGFGRLLPHATGDRAVRLRITYDEPRGGFGPETYRLRCNPASGTVRDPGRLCATIAGEPELVLAGPGRSHSCPFGLPSVRVRGDYLGQSVHVGFSRCESRPVDLLGRWRSLLPAGLQRQQRVRLDHGLGMFSLGERRSAVLALLGRPYEKTAGLSVYRPQLTEGITTSGPPLVFGVGYARSGQVVGLLSNWDELTIHDQGFSTETALAQREAIALLKGWGPVRCAGVRGLVDHPPRHRGPRTIVWMTSEHPTVDISSAGQAICPTSIASLIDRVHKHL